MATYPAHQPAVRARRPAVPLEDPILAAKITAPAVPDWAVPRPRISKLIAQGTRWCPLTAVTGPPGAGKTMAIALWAAAEPGPVRSEEHTSELQSRPHLVCRLLLEKK